MDISDTVYAMGGAPGGGSAGGGDWGFITTLILIAIAYFVFRLIKRKSKKESNVCPACKKTISPDVKFCRNCGHELSCPKC